MRKNDEDWAPTLHLGHDKLKPAKSMDVQERGKRAESRKRRKEEAEHEMRENEIAEEISAAIVGDVKYDGHCDSQSNKETQTEEAVVIDFFYEDFTSDDDKVKYYTSLPSGKVLKEVFKLVVPLPGTKREYYWKSFVATMMKLRLNLGLQDLAYWLQVHLSTMVRRYHELLHLLYTRLKFLIMWPERENLRKTMPLCFRAVNGVKVVAIIDCYEIKIEKPSNLVAKSATWSQYKQSNTVMSPQGVATFVSDTYGGRVSDKYLTRESGILKKLLPGDVLLADRGFDIAEDVGLMQASLEIPAFTKGLTQLSPNDVEKQEKLQI